MRKFTKEITLLMATVAVGAGLLVSCTNQPTTTVSMVGDLAAPEETVCSETAEKTTIKANLAGSIVTTESDSTTEFPPEAGECVTDYAE